MGKLKRKGGDDGGRLGPFRPVSQMSLAELEAEMASVSRQFDRERPTYHDPAVEHPVWDLLFREVELNHEIDRRRAGPQVVARSRIELEFADPAAFDGETDDSTFVFGDPEEGD